MQPRPSAQPGAEQRMSSSPGPTPSGLFPSGPPRPTFREPHPIRVGPLFAGGVVAAGWLFAFGLLSTSAGAYIWLTLVASLAAWAVALVLAFVGDRGAAVGITLVTALGLAVAMAVLIQRWATTGWPLW